VGDLISARLPTLAERAKKGPETSEWQVAVMEALGPELANKVNRVSLDGGRITVVVESAAWAARVRFKLGEVEDQLRKACPQYDATEVKIRPAG